MAENQYFEHRHFRTYNQSKHWPLKVELQRYTREQVHSQAVLLNPNAHLPQVYVENRIRGFTRPGLKRLRQTKRTRIINPQTSRPRCTNLRALTRNITEKKGSNSNKYAYGWNFNFRDWNFLAASRLKHETRVWSNHGTYKDKILPIEISHFLFQVLRVLFKSRLGHNSRKALMPGSQFLPP